MTSLSNMMAEDSWIDSAIRIPFLGRQLRDGRMALFLGAGASFGFGLPDWDKLTADLFADAIASDPSLEKRLPTKLVTNEARCEWLRGESGDSPTLFAARVQRLLFKGFDASIPALRGNQLLASITALVIASRRGRVSRVLSFNFDDLLERYLRFFGITVTATSVQPCWPAMSDVEVLHPHGVLSADGTTTTRIVFTERDFDEISAGEQAAWDATLDFIMQSHTCIFVGLSGADPRLRTALIRNSKRHVSLGKHGHWGIRFTMANDERLKMWKDTGVYQRLVSNWNEVPAELVEICQKAAEQFAPIDS